MPYPDKYDFPQKEQNKLKRFALSLKDESDRACAIMAATFLDYSLQKLLKRAMITGIQRELFSPQGPLSSFSAKIELSFSLGLISKDERDELNVMRKIRNDFAHSSNNRLHFLSKLIREKASRLKFSKFSLLASKELMSRVEYAKFRKYEKPRGRFEISFLMLIAALQLRTNVLRHPKIPKGITDYYRDLL